jgi:uncharacterized heparinase superfamily protein
VSNIFRKFHQLNLWFHTVRYLKPRQIFFRLYYPLRNRLFPIKIKGTYAGSIALQPWEKTPENPQSFLGNASFKFLNVQHDFENEIQWDHSAYGRLWTYNLNYFDFLNQLGISKEDGISLMEDYIKKETGLIVGKEPYPTALRIVNWIKFLSKHQIEEAEMLQFLYKDLQRLSRNLEYHLLGNHLLENGLALFLGAVFFRDTRLLKIGEAVLKTELEEQITNDGAHFERSPMYHRIILHRMLDCYKFALESNWDKHQHLISLLKTQSVAMLSWLDAVTYRNGFVPMTKDSAQGIALPAKTLFQYAESLSLDIKKVPLSDSAYRKVEGQDYECFLDLGGPSPDYQPGHAHADTFNFELWFKEKAVIIDPGVSTYEAGEVRAIERSTKFHNTVSVDGRNSSEVWGAFRVAKRARIELLEDSPRIKKACHDGFRSMGVTHFRTFEFKPSAIIITDVLTGKNGLGEAFLHFAPGTKIAPGPGNGVILANGISIKFIGSKTVKLTDYQCPVGFNKRIKAQKVIVSFSKELKTLFNFSN